MKKIILERLESIHYHVKKLYRIEQLLREINENTKKVELTPMSIGVDFSNQKDFSIETKLPMLGVGLTTIGEAGPELNFPKRYPVKDKYNRKVVAVFNNENAAREYVASCKCYYMDEVD